jgi:glycosyltransferase involved in cell wall biosynthesis
MGANSPVVDVVLPAYNVASTIRESVESIRAQTLQDIRIIIVDDGSTDDTPNLLAELAGKDNRIYLLRKSNSGIVDTLNLGLKHCEAQFVARFDADDLAYSHRLDVQLSYLRDHSDCVAVGGRVDHIDENGRPLSGLPHPGQPDQADPCWVPAREPYLIHPFLMVRRSAIMRIGGYRYFPNSEDTDLYWRLAEHGRLYNIEVSLGQYRMHSASISGSSIRNGRVMAVNSQRAALSAVRRRHGLPDLSCGPVERRNYASGTLEEIYQLGCSGLDDKERAHLSIAASAKLLELANYRPYELERSDCLFIRKSMSEARNLRNQAELNWLVTVAAARLIRNGKFAEMAALTPVHAYPVVFARTLQNCLGSVPR